MDNFDITILIRQLDYNYLLAQELVKDVSEKLMTHIPSPGLENHPAFTLGHLAVARSMIINYLGAEPEIPELWIELFKRNGPGDPRLPEKDSSKYPTKEMLIHELDKQHRKLKETLNRTNPVTLKESQDWRFSNHFPTKLECIIFMCINHESMHLGQLSAWRRTVNLPSALNKL